MERRTDGSFVVAFVARRALPGVLGGILGLGLPVAWRARTWAEPATLRLRFVHVAGATKGMDVTWRIEPRAGGAHVSIDHDFRPRIAVFAPFVDRFFTRPIAGRTLGTFKALAEALAADAADPPVRNALPDESPHMSDRRRIWITGLGMITAIGTGREAFRAGLRAARSPVTRITRFDPSAFRSQVAAEVNDFDPLAWMPPKTARQLDRFSQFGLVAGRLALDDAGLTPGVDGGAHPQRIGIYLGSALGGIAYAEEQHERYLEKGIRQVAPNLALAVFGGAAPANLGIALDVRGPILSTANSCASGAVALGEALGDLREGRVDAAIAGGVEIPLSPLAFGAFDIIRALSSGHNDEPGAAERPFDMARDGFVMGEGAALLVLEAAEVAEARGAIPYAELLGYGATSDAHHMVQPRADGTEAARAATIALDDAGVDPGEIDYVNAHASSTPIGDIAEARAIALALGERAATVPVSGTKALYGHPLGASGAIEAAICALAIRDGWAPASVNLFEPDPEVAALLPGLLRAGRDGDLPARALDVVRVRRAQRVARLRRRRRLRVEARRGRGRARGRSGRPARAAGSRRSSTRRRPRAHGPPCRHPRWPTDAGRPADPTHDDGRRPATRARPGPPGRRRWRARSRSRTPRRSRP